MGRESGGEALREESSIQLGKSPIGHESKGVCRGARRVVDRASAARSTYQLALLLDFYHTPCAPLQLYAVSPTMPQRKTRGAFIVVEGLDRSGKSTQVSLLEERLKATGVSVRLVKFPGK